MVCISADAARAALEAGDKAKAQDNTQKMAIEFARVSGENTALKQNAVSDRAIIELLLKSTKKKCFPLSVCF